MSDTTLPVLTSLTLPAVVDLSKGAAAFTFKAGAKDEAGGSGIDRVVLLLDKDVSAAYGTTGSVTLGGIPGYGDGYDDATPNSGSTDLALTTATAPGTYNIAQVWVYDLAGNRAVYTTEQLKAMGMGTSFTVTGTKADTTAPTLDGLSLPASIDLGKGDRSVTFSATAHDEAGGSGIARVALLFDNNVSASYGMTGSVTMGGVAGYGDGYDDATPNSGSTDMMLTTATAPGTYHIAEVWVYDLAGNRAVYTTEQLKAMGIASSFTVTGTTADTTGPTLDSLSLPTIIDISKGDQQVVFSAGAHDDASGKGMDRVVLLFDTELSVSYGTTGSVTLGGIAGYGDGYDDATPHSGSQSMTVTKNIAPGVYHVAQVWVYDLAGNRTSYTTAQLEALGFNTSFTVTDGKAPGATGTVAIDGNKISLDLASADWKSGTNSFSLTIKYDASSMHFDQVQLLGNGASSISTQVSESGSNGVLTLNGSAASDVAAGKDFLAALFQSSGGTAHYTIDSFILNGKTQALGAAQDGYVGHGSANADVLRAGQGSGYYDGGDGIDTLAFSGASGNYTITATGDGFSITGGSGSATVIDIERLTFSDKSVALDLDGSAGQLYRIYQAAFDRVPDKAGIGFWLASMDHGVSLGDVASGFMRSDEFAELYGGAHPSDADFLTKLYQNVLHRAADQAGYDFWMGSLKAGVSREQVLMDFSESAENQATVIGSIHHGIEYIPFM